MIHIPCLAECDHCGKLVAAVLKRPRTDTGLGGLFGGSGIMEVLCWPRGSRNRGKWVIEPYGEMFCGSRCAKAGAAAKAKARARLHWRNESGGSK